MASSRLEKIGNIYTRIQGLLKSGAMKHEDRPIFYNIYEAFPPLKEPKYGERPDMTIAIKPIFYNEDQERASRDSSKILYNLNESNKRLSKVNSNNNSSVHFQQRKDESKNRLFDFQQLSDLKE
ncbi:CLUMA_CG006535, isoform A [Clunio marinus]|uniref:CLUMA_CG006535, isoform A n=1 Tax=Clunio marinus TaxID=568069 RepID=A0A1J1I094_9DIPT|nr:CLUMA_CG006535, isoform A [Clunio marinus]